MDIQSLEPNSHKYKDQKKDAKAERTVESVVSGTVRRKKKGLFRRFKYDLFDADLSDVLKWVAEDVIFPSIKELLSKSVSQGWDMLLFGEARAKKKSTPNGTYTNYGSIYGEPKIKLPNYKSSRINHGFDDIIFESRADAERVRDMLCQFIYDYGAATVADLYELAEISSDFTDRSWGWKDLSSLTVSRTMDGYILNLPKCVVLEA